MFPSYIMGRDIQMGIAHLNVSPRNNTLNNNEFTDNQGEPLQYTHTKETLYHCYILFCFWRRTHVSAGDIVLGHNAK